MVKSLQHKLEQAVTRISELTDVLAHLDPQYTTEAYYEASAKQAMAPVLAAAANASSYGGGGGGAATSTKTGAGKSDNLKNSQATESRRF